MEKPISLFIVACIFLMYNQSMSTDVIYNVMDMGAKPDGETDSTQYFTSAWASACGNPDPSTILVPQGRYLVKAVQFTGPCNNKAFSFQMDGTLVEPSDYNVMGNSSAWLDFRQLDGFSIRGGILDGQGTDLWTCKSSGNNCPTGTTVGQLQAAILFPGG